MNRKVRSSQIKEWYNRASNMVRLVEYHRYKGAIISNRKVGNEKEEH